MFKYIGLIQSDFDEITRLYALDMKAISINSSSYLGLAFSGSTLSSFPFNKIGTVLYQLFKNFQRNTFREKKSD